MRPFIFLDIRRYAIASGKDRIYQRDKCGNKKIGRDRICTWRQPSFIAPVDGCPGEGLEVNGPAQFGELLFDIGEGNGERGPSVRA